MVERCPTSLFVYVTQGPRPWLRAAECAPVHARAEMIVLTGYGDSYGERLCRLIAEYLLGAPVPRASRAPPAPPATSPMSIALKSGCYANHFIRADGIALDITSSPHIYSQWACCMQNVYLKFVLIRKTNIANIRAPYLIDTTYWIGFKINLITFEDRIPKAVFKEWTGL